MSTRGYGFLTLSLMLLATAVAAYYSRLAHEERMIALYNATNDELMHFVPYLQEYCWENGHFPGPTLHEAARQVLDSNPAAASNERVPWQLLLSGRDYYGNNLIYEYIENGKRVRLRTPGENGLDEAGKGDDIEVEMWLDSNGAPLYAWNQRMTGGSINQETTRP